MREDKYILRINNVDAIVQEIQNQHAIFNEALGNIKTPKHHENMLFGLTMDRGDILKKNSHM